MSSSSDRVGVGVGVGVVLVDVLRNERRASSRVVVVVGGGGAASRPPGVVAASPRGGFRLLVKPSSFTSSSARKSRIVGSRRSSGPGRASSGSCARCRRACCACGSGRTCARRLLLAALRGRPRRAVRGRHGGEGGGEGRWDWALARGRGERRDDGARRDARQARRDGAGRRGGCGAGDAGHARRKIWLRSRTRAGAHHQTSALFRDFIPHTRSFVVRVLTFSPGTFRAARLEGLGCSATLPGSAGRFPALAPARRRAPSMRARASARSRSPRPIPRGASRRASTPRPSPATRPPRRERYYPHRRDQHVLKQARSRGRAGGRLGRGLSRRHGAETARRGPPGAHAERVRARSRAHHPGEPRLVRVSADARADADADAHPSLRGLTTMPRNPSFSPLADFRAGRMGCTAARTSPPRR